MKIPKPENLWVVLWCDVLKRPSRHHFARVDELEQPDDFDSEGRWQRTFGFIYRCAETGTARLFGVESVRMRAKALPRPAGPVQEAS